MVQSLDPSTLWSNTYCKFSVVVMPMLKSVPINGNTSPLFILGPSAISQLEASNKGSHNDQTKKDNITFQKFLQAIKHLNMFMDMLVDS